ncbi:MAG: glycosyltransferase, partial [Caldilineaceae bacterium]|nr:glycosyltransferase [Caldilineaceae bacterium]
EGADLVRALATCIPQVILAPTIWSDDPGERAQSILTWTGQLAAAGLLYADAPLPPPLHTAIYLRRAHTSPADALGYLTLSLHDARRQWTLQQQLAQEQYSALGASTQLLRDVQAQSLLAQERTRRLDRALDEVSDDWSQLQNSPGYGLLKSLQRTRARLVPPASRRERLLDMGLGWLRIINRGGLPGLARHLRGELAWRVNHLSARFDSRRGYRTAFVDIPPVATPPPLTPHTAPVDIVICVHNALADVERCLASVIRHTAPPYALILVDDGSDEHTRAHLADFAATHPNVTLLRNDAARGYTFAANQGMRHSSGEFVLLLNSDTIVTPDWLDRLLACAAADERIGLVGPLSNTASWQSVPQIAEGADWAQNPLPAGVDVDAWATQIAHASARLHPPMPLLNGFCLLIRRTLIDAIGLFDEEHFGAGYGEENDYALRARAAGFQLALADDAYVFHAQSRSYSDIRRKQLSDRAAEILAQKHGADVIARAVDYGSDAAVLHGIRARVAALAERAQVTEQGRRRFGGKHLLFLLPADGPGGGANVVISEARAMQRMGVDVALFNLAEKRAAFEDAYPGLDLPVFYGTPLDVSAAAARVDAVVATWHTSVDWLRDLADRPIRGYYVQDYEPHFFTPGSPEHRVAVTSYTADPNLRIFTKTGWNRQELLEQVGVESAVIGASFDIDLYRPRPRTGDPDATDRPVQVTAMVRPSSARRAPELTMRLLRRLSHRYGDRVAINIFGVESRDPAWAALPQDFNWRLAGVISPAQVAALLAQSDVFADFSTYQALGLTALEAMACGAAVIAPLAGGASSYARHDYNALMVDTANEDACWAALVRLVEDGEARGWLRRRGIYDACRFFPERAAYRILATLFAATPAGEDRP